VTTTLRAAAVVLGLVILYASVYTVSETEQVIVTQFGKPVGGPITAAGLHVKVPFIQTLHRFDKRWLEFDGDPNQIPTKDKKYIWVETYARWRIADPLRFYQAVTDERGGQSRLDDVVDGQTRNAVASYDLIEIVRSSNRSFQVTEELEGIGSAEALTKIEVGREKIAQVILKKAAEITPQFGIELEDVRFKRLNYIDTVQQKVFERMISERRRIAERSRSEGQGRAAESGTSWAPPPWATGPPRS
jgi:membrane protease subunit HflC